MRCLRLILPTLIGVVLVVGCHEGQRTTSPAPVAQPSAALSAEADGQPASPPNEYRRQLTRDAMRGLRYDTGRVEIDPAEAATIVARRDHEQALAEYQRGQDLLARNAIIASLEAHTKAVLLDPDEAQLYVGLGDTLLTKRKTREAAAAFRTALELDPKSVSARFGLADALNRMGQLEESIATLRLVLEQDQQHAKAHSRLAIALYYAGHEAEAWEHVHQAEALGHEVPPQFRALLAGRMAEP